MDGNDSNDLDIWIIAQKVDFVLNHDKVKKKMWQNEFLSQSVKFESKKDLSASSFLEFLTSNKVTHKLISAKFPKNILVKISSC